MVLTALAEEEEEVEDVGGGGRGVVASGEALVLPSGSEEWAEDRDGGCRYLPPPSLQLVTSEHTNTIKKNPCLICINDLFSFICTPSIRFSRT